MKTILILCSFLVLVSCTEEDLSWEEKNEERCKEDMTFDCDYDEDDLTSFKGKLNGEEFCISAPYNGNINYYGIGTKTTTSTDNPVWSSENIPQSSYYALGIIPPIGGVNGSTLPNFAPLLRINTPTIQDSIIYTAEKYIEDFVKEGNLVLRDKDVDEYSGFDFYIFWKCDMKPYYGDSETHPSVGFYLSPLKASQDDMVFRVSEIRKFEEPWSIKYHITFEIECDLYYLNEGEYFGRLEDGAFKTVVEIPR